MTGRPCGARRPSYARLPEHVAAPWDCVRAPGHAAWHRDRGGAEWPDTDPDGRAGR